MFSYKKFRAATEDFTAILCDAAELETAAKAANVDGDRFDKIVEPVCRELALRLADGAAAVLAIFGDPKAGAPEKKARVSKAGS